MKFDKAVSAGSSENVNTYNFFQAVRFWANAALQPNRITKFIEPRSFGTMNLIVLLSGVPRRVSLAQN
jgi:hypothetical protein